MTQKSPVTLVASAWLLASAAAASAAVVYQSPGPHLMNQENLTLPDTVITRGGDADDALYFRFTVEPISDTSTEGYYAAFQLFEGDSERLGVGNAWGPHAYSAFATSIGDVDLNSANPDPGFTFQIVRNTDLTTLLFKVDFQPGGDDLITVWLDPDLALPEGAQDPLLTTSFAANATFDNIRLRHGGGGDGWTFSNILIADSGTAPGFFAIPEPSSALLGALGLLATLRRRR